MYTHTYTNLSMKALLRELDERIVPVGNIFRLWARGTLAPCVEPFRAVLAWGRCPGARRCT